MANGACERGEATHIRDQMYFENGWINKFGREVRKNNTKNHKKIELRVLISTGK